MLYRAAVEELVRDQGATGNDLYRRIESLRSGPAAELVADFHEARMLGNDSIHDGWIYSADEVQDVASLIEEAPSCCMSSLKSGGAFVNPDNSGERTTRHSRAGKESMPDGRPTRRGSLRIGTKASNEFPYQHQALSRLYSDLRAPPPRKVFKRSDRSGVGPRWNLTRVTPKGLQFAAEMVADVHPGVGSESWLQVRGVPMGL